jgi:hypothetical protein
LVANMMSSSCVRVSVPSVAVGILLALDVASENFAWDDHVRGEENVDGIVDHCTGGDDLGIVRAEVGVEQLDVSLDGGAM